MVDLSVIIVNYNVKYFLAQCLNSILNSALEELRYEVIVVDNASTDGSFPFLEEKFTHAPIKFIKEEHNLGFAKACNKGLGISNGDVVLFLNPDTLLSKDTLYKSFSRLKCEDKLGAIGVKMVDGKGNFLPESKRSFPTPFNSLLKLTGLKKFRPNWVKPYNLDHLDEDTEHYVEVLCGAYFMIKRHVLEKTGGFDEDFFMYGEDIDLSKRIGEKGYLLLYYPQTSILHYKGESHGAKNLKYFSRFYNAMSIYADKHYSKALSTILRVTIVFAGIMAVIKNLMGKWATILIDGIIFMAVFFLMKNIWALLYFKDLDYYPSQINYVIIAYVLIVLISLYISEHYKPFASFRNTLSAWAFSVLGLFVFYALAPENWRFSRMLLVAFAGISLPVIIGTRLIYARFNWIRGSYLFLEKKSDAMVVSSTDSYPEIKSILQLSIRNVNVIGCVDNYNNQLGKDCGLGCIQQLDELISVYNPNHVIFNLDEYSSDKLFHTLKKYGKHLNIYGYSKNTFGIVGSPGASEAGEVFTTQFTYRLDMFSSRLLKRFFDVFTSLLVFICAPILILTRKNLICDAVKVVAGKYTWVGYHLPDNKEFQLPRLSPGILSPGKEYESMEGRHLQNLNYARNYSLFTDIEMMIRYIWERK